MKRHKKILSLVLALVIVAGLVTTAFTAGADSSTRDLDGDGKFTIHDVQLAKEAEGGVRQLTTEQKLAKGGYSATQFFNKLLGKVHTPKLVSGVYQLTNFADLTFLQDNASKGYSFKLMNNIDLKGADWAPIDKFKGTFDGNGKIISNALITTARKNSNTGATVKNLENQGFFAEIMAGATVKNLELKNIEIVATENAQFMGLLAGTNRGTVTGCFTHGKITDRRETPYLADGKVTVVAALIGRNTSGATYQTVSNRNATEPNAPGTTSKYVWLNRNGKIPDHHPDPIKIAAQLAVDVADRKDIQVCLSHNAPTNSTVTQFQEISGSYGVSDTMKIKQDRVVEYMLAEGSIKWTTPEKMVYAKDKEGEVIEKEHAAGTTQVGIPFNDFHNGLERFMYILEDSNEDGVYEVNSKLANEEDPNFYFSNRLGSADSPGDTGNNGWIRYTGNDCSSAIQWAWLQISPVSTYRAEHGISQSYAFSTETGVYAESCRHVYAYDVLDGDHNSYYGHKHGIVKIGDYDFFETDDETGEITKTFLAAEVAQKQDTNGDGVIAAVIDGRGATTSLDLWNWNADNTKTAENEKYHKLYATYGQARKGDAIHTWFTGDAAVDTYNEDVNGDGVWVPSEDTNHNGIMDPGEDTNGNGKLDANEDVNNNGVWDKELPGRIWEGHMRLLAEDPVIIRNRDGYIDIEASYVITHGHGGGVASRKSNAGNTWSNANSWSLYQKYYLADLDTTSGECKNTNDSSRCYIPITCAALRQETTVDALTEAVQWTADSCTAPYSGTIRTSHALSTVTVEVYTDAAGTKLVLSDTKCALPDGAGLRSNTTQTRYTPQWHRDVKLEQLFPNMQEELKSKLSVGVQYYYKVKVNTVSDFYTKDASTGKYGWAEDVGYESGLRSFTYKAP